MTQTAIAGDEFAVRRRWLSGGKGRITFRRSTDSVERR